MAGLPTPPPRGSRSAPALPEPQRALDQTQAMAAVASPTHQDRSGSLLDDLPAEWFRPGPLTEPPPRRMAIEEPEQEAMLDAPPGDPAPQPRVLGARRSTPVVLALSLLPVVIIGGYVWKLLQPTQVLAQPGVSATTSTTARPVPTSARPSVKKTVLAPQATPKSTPSRVASEPGVLSSWPVGVPTNATRCGVNVYAAPSTDCGFALDVATQVSGSKASVVRVYATIPHTKKTYRMTCKRASTTVCGGGIDLRVYLAR